MNTSTVPRLEQLDLFYGFFLVRKSVPKPKLRRALTPREKDVLKRARALNDPLIIEAINLFNAEVRDVIWECTAEEEARLGANILGNAVQISRPLRQCVARDTERLVGSDNIDESCTRLRNSTTQRLSRL
jgi:hypothetical protein